MTDQVYFHLTRKSIFTPNLDKPEPNNYNLRILPNEESITYSHCENLKSIYWLGVGFALITH